MTVVLDTNVLVWAVESVAALGHRAGVLIDDAVAKGTAHVSAISFWELSLKISKGKFRLTRTIADWRADVLRFGIREVPVDGAIGIAANELEGLHKDPADRLIVATAFDLGASLITADTRLLSWKGPLVCIDARV
ncbi:type II toxin-antitoxin system VapC family toxin [Reyranella sp.]|jgi:PIN domain nuclease of toxin-antitoxin system|uniref:type II toxin-antitoxin system VapC family toxin n=1 Tax=Reyranella sp. TaxID=1929291 RepID=UPI002F929A41